MMGVVMVGGECWERTLEDLVISSLGSGEDTKEAKEKRIKEKISLCSSNLKSTYFHEIHFLAPKVSSQEENKSKLIYHLERQFWA